MRIIRINEDKKIVCAWVSLESEILESILHQDLQKKTGKRLSLLTFVIFHNKASVTYDVVK